MAIASVEPSAFSVESAAAARVAATKAASDATQRWIRLITIENAARRTFVQAEARNGSRSWRPRRVATVFLLGRQNASLRLHRRGHGDDRSLGAAIDAVVGDDRVAPPRRALRVETVDGGDAAAAAALGGRHQWGQPDRGYGRRELAPMTRCDVDAPRRYRGLRNGAVGGPRYPAKSGSVALQGSGAAPREEKLAAIGAERWPAIGRHVGPLFPDDPLAGSIRANDVDRIAAMKR